MFSLSFSLSLSQIWNYIKGHVLILSLSLVCLYFFVLYILSSYEEVNEIQRLTLHYNFCSEGEVDCRIKEILVDLHYLTKRAYFVENKEQLWLTAAQVYASDRRFRNICYKNGLKHRMEKNFQVMF